ncbi:hypothetical protein LSAT2_005136 [Lamellibrachia satsuma]|nr:hypothetical protein LSAT2_005136 [Lamellibrachia satsuma]
MGNEPTRGSPMVIVSRLSDRQVETPTCPSSPHTSISRSAHYQDICSLLEIYNAGQRCPRILRKRNIPCRCPFNQGLHTLETLRVLIPPLDGVLGMFAKGKYEASVRIYSHDKRELGCLHMTFRLKRRRKSNWLIK